MRPLFGDRPKTTMLGSLSAAVVANFVEFWRKSGGYRQSLRQKVPTKLILGQAPFTPHWRKLRARAFTLPDLLVVVALVAVLAAIAVPILARSRARSRQ